MSRGFSGGKQMIKAANARNRGRVCLCYQNMTTIQFSSEQPFRVSTRFTTLLFAVRTSTVATASKEVTMITSTHKLPLSTLLWKVLYFLLSRANKLDGDFLHWQLLSFV